MLWFAVACCGFCWVCDLVVKFVMVVFADYIVVVDGYNLLLLVYVDGCFDLLLFNCLCLFCWIAYLSI